jgi:SnoaL-like domain
MNKLWKNARQALLLGVAGLAGLLGANPASADSDRRSDTEEVAALIYCYAKGTDAIGDSTTNTDPLGKGLAIYNQCFTPDAEFRAWFPQQPFDSQTFPDPSGATPFIGPANWANFVNTVFRGNGYTFTQHIISNVDVSVHGRTAKLTAYLNASHVISGSTVGGPSRCVAVANGTYSLSAKKFRNEWRVTKLDLTLLTFNPVFETGAGCSN